VPAVRSFANDVVAVLNGEGIGVHAERTLRRRRAAARRQPHDDRSRSAELRQPEIYKGILTDRARGVFNGKINVRADAQKTDAKQTNRALLLSEDAADQHEATARDFRQRRQMHARRGPWVSSTMRRSSISVRAGERP